MALTLGTTGMDSATEAELRTAFQQITATHGSRWQLVDEKKPPSRPLCGQGQR